jgi:hypothetical protein
MPIPGHLSGNAPCENFAATLCVHNPIEKVGCMRSRTSVAVQVRPSRVTPTQRRCHRVTPSLPAILDMNAIISHCKDRNSRDELGSSPEFLMHQTNEVRAFPGGGTTCHQEDKTQVGLWGGIQGKNLVLSSTDVAPCRQGISTPNRSSMQH